jgi:transcriptional regulator with XRE-family HTH domain
MIMPKDKLIELGKYIRTERLACNLTQQELADQCNLAIKTVQNIENGRMNPSFEILSPLVKRLGLSGNTVFDQNNSEQDEEIQHFIGKLLACSPENRKVLLHTLDCLYEQLSALQRKSAIKDFE